MSAMTRPTTMKPLRFLAVAATAGLLAACGSGDPGDETVLEPGPATDGSGSSSDVELVGTTWDLNEVVTASGDTTAPEQEAHLEFTDDGRVEGNSGCNGYGGDAEIEGDQIKLGPVIGTMKACSGTTGEVDQAFATVLQGTITASVAGDALTLTNADGASLTFSATDGD